MLALAALWAESIGAEVPKAVLAPGDYSFSLKHDGAERSYLVHMPPQAAGGAALAVVLNFHGAGSNGKQQEKYSQMDAAADRDGFIAVYPNGSSRFGNRLTWNAGFCCAYAMTHGIDDVGFVLALIADLAARTRIQVRQVYATGLSNGAMLSYRLAAQASEHIAAIAPVAGTMVVKNFFPRHPMPIMAFNSVDDPFVRYEGGVGSAIAALFHRDAARPGIEKMLGEWREFDQCPGQAQVSPAQSGKPGTPNQGVTVTRYDWAPCNHGTAVVLWKFTGSGHVWPGGIQNHFGRMLGRSTDLIDANEQMWQFFRQFKLPAQ